MLDYLAVEQTDPAVLTELGAGLKRGAELAGIEIPGGELAQLPEMIKGHPSPRGLDLVGAAFGTVAPDALVLGDRIEVSRHRDRPALLGTALERLHARAAGAAGRGGTEARRRAGRDRQAACRRAARADRDLRAPDAGAAAIERRRARPRPHHRRRPAEPAAAQRQRRLRDRRSAGRAGDLLADRRRGRTSARPRCTRSSTWERAFAAWWRPATSRRRSTCCASTTLPRSASAASPADAGTVSVPPLGLAGTRDGMR